jgi:hypothetical protein
MWFFPPHKKRSVKDDEAEALKERLLSGMDKADKEIKEVRKMFADPTLQIFYATRVTKGKKK